MLRRVNLSGLVIAGTGFFLTRFTVTLTLFEDPVPFYLSGIVPLTLGLGLAAFGVALAVGDVDGAVVRTVATWCVLGTAAMLVLVVLTLVGSNAGGMPAFTTVQSRVALSNFLIGGSVGGTLTGLYASSNRHQREALERQANRLEVLNRLLRHEVLNALTVIRGYAPVTDGDPEAVDLIQSRSDDIESTIEEVRYLSRSARSAPATGEAVPIEPTLTSSVEAVARTNPEAAVSVGSVPADLSVRANPRLERVFTELLGHAVGRSTDAPPEARVAVEAGPAAVRVTVSHAGPALPAGERALLETGAIGDYDDPSSGFELNVARLLVESFGGSIETGHEAGRTEVTVVLPRGGGALGTGGLFTAGVTSVRPAVPTLVVTLAAALVGAVTYGAASELLGGSIAGIGVFYGAANPVVGWITHSFHSVVFGFVYAGLVSLAPRRHQGRLGPHVAIGLAWGVVLWAGAAGVVAPLWLRLLGIPASLPSLSGSLLVAHLVWGLTLGLLTAWGYRIAVPRLERVTPARGRSAGED